VAGGGYLVRLAREEVPPLRPVWTVERTQHRRFPIRIAIEQEGRVLLVVRAQSPWPGPGQQVFCLRERQDDPTEYREPLERVEVAHLARVGRKLAVVLDRPSRKRCEFLDWRLAPVDMIQ